MFNIDKKIQNNESKNNILPPGGDTNKKRKSLNIIQPKHKKDLEDLVENEPKKEAQIASHKKRNLIIIIAIILGFLILAAIILIIGHFKFGWFMKKNDLVIVQNRQENLVSRYLEKKSATNYYDVEGLDEDQRNKNYIISTDFIVGINKKTKINSIFDMVEDDYLCESFLLIINLTLINETNSEYLGGLNIFDKTKSAEELIKLNDEFFLQMINKEKNPNITNKKSFIENIPFCKFYYFLNGTLKEIYYPEGINEFYKSAMHDLIEKITPKLSKSLYQGKTNKRRLENEGEENINLNYEEVVKNGTLEKFIIYEDIMKKEFNEKNSNINSKIIRTFNSSGDITSLEMKGEAIFKSPSSNKKEDLKNSKSKNLRLIEEEKDDEFETNETYSNLGFNEFKINVTSNMDLINNEIEPKILEKLKNLSKLISFEKYKDSNENIIKNKGKENIFNNSEKYPLNSNDSEKRNLDQKNITNFPRSYTKKYNLFIHYFFWLKLTLDQSLHINHITNLRKSCLNLILGRKEIILDEAKLYHNSQKNDLSHYVAFWEPGVENPFSVFGFSINTKFDLTFKITNGISYNTISEKMYAKGYTNIDVGASGTYGSDFFLVSYTVRLTGKIAKGSSYIQANSNYGSNLATFEFHKDFSTCSLNLFISITVNYIFWKRTYSSTFNVY